MITWANVEAANYNMYHYKFEHKSAQTYARREHQLSSIESAALEALVHKLNYEGVESRYRITFVEFSFFKDELSFGNVAISFYTY